MTDKKPRHGRAGERRPSMPFYALDWLGSMRVRRMTPAQRGWYIEGLCMQWAEGPLPADPVKFARLFPGANEEDLAELMDVFPLVPDGGGRLNGRLERERELAEERSETQKKLGQAGNKARWGTSRDNESGDTGSRSDPAGIPQRSRKRPVQAMPTGSRGASQTDPISSPPAPAPAPSSSPSERSIAPAADAAGPPPKVPRAIPNTPHHETIAAWCTAYEDAIGERYSVQSKDAAAVKAMLKRHTPQEIAAQAQKLLFCESSFHAEHRTLVWLNDRWNEIGQLARAHSLRIEGIGSKVVREAARAETSGERPGILDWIDADEPKRLSEAHA